MFSKHEKELRKKHNVDQTQYETSKEMRNFQGSIALHFKNISMVEQVLSQLDATVEKGNADLRTFPD